MLYSGSLTSRPNLLLVQSHQVENFAEKLNRDITIMVCMKRCYGGLAV